MQFCVVLSGVKQTPTKRLTSALLKILQVPTESFESCTPIYPNFMQKMMKWNFEGADLDE